ncbi:hypothetical protein [uncultured Draconibacterium sp.]|uniref:hypothetical protein n=1 Tax=uncultured Draconibacterium sp. TaxID=1573823 RepID=UPI0032168F41
MSAGWTAKEKKEYEEWLREKSAIVGSSPLIKETAEQKAKAIKKALENTEYFARRYCSHLATKPFGWFHKKSAKQVIDNNDMMGVYEFPREHAKSILFGVILPLQLKARGELTGMMLGSANQEKARGLLGDIQAELMFNKQYIADFGEQYSLGAWKDGYFVTADGIGFWAFGRGQSPRGTRKAQNRPNYGLIDDIDDAQIVKNVSRVMEAVDWVLGDFYGAMPIERSRLVCVSNRTHKNSIIAHLAGNIEPDDPIREGIYHIQVFALENPRTRKKDLSEKGIPAWKENYTREMIMAKLGRMGWRIGMREYFHEHNVEGKTFKEKDLPWVECLPLSRYDKLLTYNDPSYKKSQFSDCKSIVLLGKTGRYFDIIDCYVKQCTTAEMVRAHYTIAAQLPEKVGCKHWMEANFIQDLMLEEYWRYGEANGGMLRIRGDKRSKPDKEVRIENLTPFTDMGFIRFNVAQKSNPHMIELRTQFIGFPDYQWDDGPDSVEGGIFKLNTGKSKKSSGSKPARQGRYAHQTKRSAY